MSHARQPRSQQAKKLATAGRLGATRSRKLREVMTIAEEEGLLRGERTQIVRGRMPKELVARAKKRTGIDSHELGHSLADITDVAVPFKGLPMPSDVDTGAWFLDCVKDAYKPSQH